LYLELNTDNNNDTKFLDNLIRFIRLLRKSGINIGTESSINLLKALKSIKIGTRDEFYWTLHSTLINKNEDKELFDQCFYLFWQNPKIMEQIFNLLLPQIGKQSAPKNQKKRLKRIEDNISKKISDIDIKKRNARQFDSKMSWSDKTIIKSKDFDMMSLDEINSAQKEIKKLLLNFKNYKSRRWKKKEIGSRISQKDTLKKSIRSNALINLIYKSQIKKYKPLVVLIDVSGSMESYSRIMLFFSHLLINIHKDVEVFIFGTKLTRITKFLQNNDIDFALNKIGNLITDWSGGTKIASSLAEFNQNWSRRILAQNQTLLLISDGLDRDKEKNLEFEIKRLSLFSSKIIWLNPLLRFSQFQPKVKSIKIILKYVNDFIPIHNVNSIESLIKKII
jgi:uncharacterized protein with von Willebrand factor type A (vWA) domain